MIFNTRPLAAELFISRLIHMRITPKSLDPKAYKVSAKGQYPLNFNEF